MRVDGVVGRVHLPELEVVRPSEHGPVQPPHHQFGVQQPVPRCRQFADLAADAADAVPARSRANVGTARARAVIASDAVPEELHRFPRHSQAASLRGVDR